MFENYRNRMAYKGKYMGETMRNQTQHVVDATWMNSIFTRPVCVKEIAQGLPPAYLYTDDFEEVIWAHFEPHKKYSVGSNEVDYYLTFQPQVVRDHPEIKVGSYVSIPNIHDELEYWLIVHCEEDNGLIQTRVIKCNWTLKWIANGVIHECLGVFRGGTSDAIGLENDGYITSVDSQAAIWLPTNIDTNTININTRFLISDAGRIPPQAWKTSRIRDIMPIGLTKISVEQDTYNAQHDNDDLMIADYWSGSVEPTPINPTPIIGSAAITYNGTKPTVKVGGSAKVFTAAFSNENTTVDRWIVSDATGNISAKTNNYTIEHEGAQMKLKVALNYNLIGTVLTVEVIGTDGSTAYTQVEVI